MPLAPLAAVLVPLALLQPPALPVTDASATFSPASSFVPPAAVSYAPDLVPYGGHVHVVAVQAAGHTSVTLTVDGLAADHAFPAHVHTKPCGPVASASGPHYQDQLDPVQPSTDPAYANERNELRLALRTGPDGAGRAESSVAWTFRPGEARSIVLHAGPDAGGRAATTGVPPAEGWGRVACVNVNF